MFESISSSSITRHMRSSSFAVETFLSSLIFIVVASKDVIVVGHLLKLHLVGLLLELFLLVSVWIDAGVALLVLLSMWITSLLERLLFHLIIVIKVGWRFVAVIRWHLTHYHLLLLPHAWMTLVAWIASLVKLLRCYLGVVLLWSVVGNSMQNLSRIWLLKLWHLNICSSRYSRSHAYNRWNFSLIFWRTALCMLLTLLFLNLIFDLVIISKNTLRRLLVGIFSLITVWVIVVGVSSHLSGAKLWVAGFKLFCHGLIDRLGNCAFVNFSVSRGIVAHKVMVIHIFLNSSGWSARIFDIALVDILNLFNISLYHVKISGFKLFCFLEETGLLNVSQHQMWYSLKSKSWLTCETKYLIGVFVVYQNEYIRVAKLDNLLCFPE